MGTDRVDSIIGIRTGIKETVFNTTRVDREMACRTRMPPGFVRCERVPFKDKPTNFLEAGSMEMEWDRIHSCRTDNLLLRCRQASEVFQAFPMLIFVFSRPALSVLTQIYVVQMTLFICWSNCKIPLLFSFLFIKSKVFGRVFKSLKFCWWLINKIWEDKPNTYEFLDDFFPLERECVLIDEHMIICTLFPVRVRSKENRMTTASCSCVSTERNK